MKKSILKFIFGASFATLLLSSCLGDSDNSFRKENDFCFITDDNYTVVAAPFSTGGVHITSSQIRGLDLGKCYFISYEIKSSSGNYNGVANAENVSLSSTDPIPQFQLQEMQVPPGGTDSVAVNTFGVSAFRPDQFQGDRWLFGTGAAMKTDGKIDAQFYYDPQNQIDSDGTTITSDKNRVVIDVRFSKRNEDPTGTVRDYSFLIVGNLSALRTLRRPTFSNGEDQAVLYIKFRYYKKGSGLVYTSGWNEYGLIYNNN